jgi:hypothetical protein
MATTRNSTSARKLHEERLLALTRVPEVDAGFLADEHMEAWGELVEMRSEAFVAELRGFIRSRRAIREPAIEHLAWTGMEEVVADVRRFIGGRNLKDLNAAMTGASNAVTYGWASRRFATGAYAAVEPIVTGRRDLGTSAAAVWTAMSAVDALLGIDRGRAIKVMKSGACLRAGNRALLGVVLGLCGVLRESPKDFGAPIEAGLLWPLFEGAAGKTRVPRDRREGLKGAILLLTADSDPRRTRAEAKTLVRRKGEGADFAREALRRCERIPEARDALIQLERSPRRFGAAAREVLRAFALNQHVRSDGILAYLGDRARELGEASAGLRRLGLGAIAAELEKAARQVARTRGRPTWRQVEAAALEEAGDKTWIHRLEDRFVRVVEVITARVERYIWEHPEQFRDGRRR